jgi:hypothetical protein
MLYFLSERHLQKDAPQHQSSCRTHTLSYHSLVVKVPCLPSSLLSHENVSLWPVCAADVFSHRECLCYHPPFALSSLPSVFLRYFLLAGVAFCHPHQHPQIHAGCSTSRTGRSYILPLPACAVKPIQLVFALDFC